MLRWTENIMRMSEMRNEYKISAEKPEGKISIRKL
jgi:hypothetical protein